ncbi:MAG: prolyl oligopeptidase family serine peptidase [Marinoscillum sp.]|uniref:prolyl oligopeptidase family serine peptidase n=1 Tax=Marinoscillum sp. TaxID=2024838 RepID=UPI0032F47BB7
MLRSLFLPSLLSVLILLSSISSSSQNLEYPPTIKRPTVNEYHGYKVMDEYQWLEEIDRPEVRIWADAQNDVSTKHLRKLANRNNTINMLNKYMAQEKRWSTYANINFSSNHESNYRLFYDDNFSAPSIYYRERSFNNYRVLVDPKFISNSDRIVVENFAPSKDDRYLAYLYSRNGSDWREIKIQSTKGGISPPEVLTGVKFSNVRWFNNGFFYKRYREGAITDQTLDSEIYYHRLFTEQKEDSLVFKTNSPLDDFHLSGTYQEDMYVLEIDNPAKDHYSYLYFDPAGDVKAFRPLHYKVNYSLEFIDYKYGRFYMEATIHNKSQIIAFTAQNPLEISRITPEYQDAQITGYELMDDKIVVSYQALSKPFMTVMDLEGNVLKEIDLPGGVSISNMSYQKASGDFIFLLQSFTIPPVVCKLDLNKFDYSVVERTGVNFDFESFKFSTEYFPSKDGTMIPIFMVYKNELKKDGKTPFLLSAYGGFGKVSNPRYDAGIIYFIEQGGAFAFVHARGGGELGYEWWKNGRLDKKQNTFDDVIAAAEYLIDENHTQPEKMGFIGSSNGGLVAGAVLTQRPELFGAMVLKVAALDMLRYESFTVGPKWVNEFGSVADSLEFLNLASYSPYHNLKENIQYPPTLLVTAHTDDRVPPLHSFKFAAAMQGLSDANPVLLWTQQGTGHSGAANVSEQVENKAFIYGFLHEYLLRKD